MKKVELNALEKVFEAEINGQLPFQARSGIYQRLVEDGYLYHKTFTLNGNPPVRISGYELTHAGRYAYCQTCKGENND